MSIIFISHPFKDDPLNNRNRNMLIVNELSRNNPQNIYLSPLHIFSYLDNETSELREQIMEVCFKLIEMSDEVYVYGDSEECAKEMNYAWKKHIPVVDKR